MHPFGPRHITKTEIRGNQATDIIFIFVLDDHIDK